LDQWRDSYDFAWPVCAIRSDGSHEKRSRAELLPQGLLIERLQIHNTKASPFPVGCNSINPYSRRSRMPDPVDKGFELSIFIF
jgi:hypothetical protein